MKAITLTQPWATLVAIGAKRIETRSWATGYRGKLAIHAAKGLAPLGGKAGLIRLCNTRYFQQSLYATGFVTHNHCDWDAEPTDLMLFGAVIATVDLIGVIRIDRALPDSISQQELAFGDYSIGRYAWLLENVEVLKEPITYRGALGLWEWK